ncbi:putative short-chain dehydrogenase [Apodospora peruviana]|uniref:Short-chain dehydrogenase n=1 Tax=Apodospora peruviana TaxID=516989 RepID=A0AAE0MEU9_9PEZI|nr:putative short-chain dehydrogenase [Apodospora peruviana]
MASTDVDAFNPYRDLYEATPKGPGDARPTAMRVLEDNDAIGKWQGRVVLVTGGTSGIGEETVRSLHATGADVYFTARDMDKAEKVAGEIQKSSSGTGKIIGIPMDLDSLDSVKEAALIFLSKSKKLNVLINNAGIMGTPQSTTKDGHERQFGVNHLAHFALTALLLPTMIESSSPSFSSRIVNVASAAHRYSSVVFDDINLSQPGAYEPYRAYGQSKTANIWTANYIDRVFGPKGVHAYSVQPGAVWSGLYQYADPAMLEEWGKDSALMAQMQSPQQGAANTMWAAAGKAWEGTGGKYICNCRIAPPSQDMAAVLDPGYAPHAYDEEGENRLWKLSGKLAGVALP